MILKLLHQLLSSDRPLLKPTKLLGEEIQRTPVIENLGVHVDCDCEPSLFTHSQLAVNFATASLQFLRAVRQR